MFKTVSIKDISENVVRLLDDSWGLVTAGNKDSFNTMTVSWGAVGELWGKDMVTIYIRPQRYTKEFLDESDYFTLSFYPNEYKKALGVCGTKSGRDIDKAKECSLTPDFSENAPFFKEANIVVVCKKVAVSKFDKENFVDDSVMDNYAENDFHYIYYGEIEKVLIK